MEYCRIDLKDTTVILFYIEGSAYAYFVFMRDSVGRHTGLKIPVSSMTLCISYLSPYQWFDPHCHMMDAVQVCGYGVLVSSRKKWEMRVCESV